MKEDKALKELLQQFAMEETSTDFTQNILQQIEMITASKPAAKPLVNARLLWLTAGVFVVVCTVLLVLCFKNKFVEMPAAFPLTIPVNYISQLLWFIVVFWVGMLVSLFHQRKNKWMLQF